jgi:signal transduction histidine kinase
LLILLGAVVLTAHAFIHRTLRPIRLLHEGVSKLSEGNLEVVVARNTRDELGALTTAFNQMVQRVRDMVKARDQLLVDVSHELRSPITRLKVALEFIPDSEKKRRLAGDVAEMETMITEILEIERLAAGGGLEREPEDLVGLLREVIEGFADRRPGVSLKAAAEVTVTMDGGRVRTVVKNVLENAVKFSPPESGSVEVAVEEAEDGVAVRIRDHGPGIPPDDLPSLFEPFFRVDRSRSRRTGGYGLGLAMSKRIMEAHGGSIRAENDPEGGATFTLTLPR